MSEKKLLEFKTGIPHYDKPFLPTPGSEVTFYVELPENPRQAELVIMRIKDMINRNLVATQVAEHTVEFNPVEKTEKIDRAHHPENFKPFFEDDDQPMLGNS